MILFSVGKRKTSIAIIILKNKKLNNKNKILINNKNITVYFKSNKYFYNKIYLPLLLTKNLNNNLEFNIKVKGGGLNGQIDAITLGISRILCKMNNKYTLILKKKKLLTRDSRIVERKKYGRKKSRKKFQFSKR
ncbi:MAG: 30S ribosomal protein S9 [Candidatus Shikimatogenerans bostrichidophilus]|nr:MAG: 30S ribosomal protein S9 [Candidatus Shikimatogenerans bostrichidophilus]